MNRYQMKYLVPVMDKMGIDVYANIQEVNNSLLNGMPYIVDDVEFKPDGDDTFIAVRRLDKEMKKGCICWIDISKAFRSHGIASDDNDVEHTLNLLDIGSNVTRAGLKFKACNDKTFRVYDVRRKVTA